MRVLTKEYINPFDVTIEKNDLLNLSSGIPLQGDEVWKSDEIGQKIYEIFFKEQIQENSKPFNDPIRKSKLETFNNVEKAKVTRNGKTGVIEINRKAIGKLLAISLKFEQKIDFEVALTYPLTIVPLSLSNPDNSQRVTPKSKLMEVFLQYQEENDAVVEIDAKIFVVDFIAQIRVITKKIPETCEQLSLNVLQAIPKGYERVDLVANTYSLVSIKTAERNERGSSSKMSIKSVKYKILRDYSLFM